MGIVTFTDTLTTKIPPAKLFNVLFVDPAKHATKAAPQYIKSVETIEGTGGPGTIILFNFAEGAPVKYAKHRVDALDKDNLCYADTVIEGGPISDKVKSVSREVKLEASPDGGTVNTTIVKYHLKEGAEITEEETKPAKEGAHAVFKAVEAYVLANPDV